MRKKVKLKTPTKEFGDLLIRSFEEIGKAYRKTARELDKAKRLSWAESRRIVID